LSEIREVNSNMEIFKLQSELCKCMSDPKRLCIIHELRESERSVNELAELLGMKQSNTSQHLAVLRKAGVITPRKEGSTVYYKLVNPKIAKACDLVREVIAEQLRSNQRLTSLMQ